MSADCSGTVQTSYTYDPFGKPSSTGATSSNTQQYTGLQNDGTGLQYNRARYYSPTLQRFIAEDPWASAAAASTCMPMSGNDPINFYRSERIAAERTGSGRVGISGCGTKVPW